MWKLLMWAQKNLVWSIPAAMLLGLLFGWVAEPGFLRFGILPLTFLMVYPMMVAVNVKELFKSGGIKLQGAALLINFVLVPLLGYGLGLVFFADQRADLGVKFPRRSNTKARHRIAQRALEVLVIEDFRLKQQQRCGRAFLPAVAERGMEHVFDRLVAIGQGRHDRRVLAAGLRIETHRRRILQHGQRRFRAAGQDHRIDVRARDQRASGSRAGARDELQRPL